MPPALFNAVFWATLSLYGLAAAVVAADEPRRATGSTIHVAVDQAYGVPPHEVRLQATVTGPRPGLRLPQYR